MTYIFYPHFALMQNEAKNQENMMLQHSRPELARHIFWPSLSVKREICLPIFTIWIPLFIGTCLKLNCKQLTTNNEFLETKSCCQDKVHLVKKH